MDAQYRGWNIMKSGFFLGLLGAVAISTSYAADLRKAPPEPVAPVVTSDLLFGSLEFDVNALASPKQLGLDAATAPYVSGVGKITYMPASRLIGVQGDVNLMGTSTDWINPASKTHTSTFIYGGAAHVFTEALPNAKIGAFFTADWTQMNIAKRQVGTLVFPMYQGGVEGQYLLTQNWLVRGRAGGGSIIPDSSANGMPNGRIASLGLGTTYAFTQSWSAGADLQFSRITGFGLPVKLDIFDLTGFAEYKFVQSPFSVRGEIGWMRAQPRLFGAHIDLDAFRVRLGVKYAFGGGDNGRPRSLLDSEFQTHNFIAGLR